MKQLDYCTKCENRKFNPSVGIVCGLTSEKPTFEETCNDFIKDENAYVAPKPNVEELKPYEMKGSLSSKALEQLKSEQKLVPGIIASLMVGLLGSILWEMITVATEFQIGYMAVAIGAGVGLTMRKFGKGIDIYFGILGAAIALFSVILGNILGILGFAGQAENLNLLETMIYFDYSYLLDIMAETFSPIDLVFYAIAIFEGYKFSFRKVTAEELDAIENNMGIENT